MDMNAGAVDAIHAATIFSIFQNKEYCSYNIYRLLYCALINIFVFSIYLMLRSNLIKLT